MKLTEKRYVTFAKIGIEINKRIDRACELYNSLLEEAGVPRKDKLIWHNGTTYLDDLERGLYLGWDTSLGYGDHSSGDNFIPWNCLVDELWQEETTKRATETIKKYKATQRSEKRHQDNFERDQYNKLKAKFDPEK